MFFDFLNNLQHCIIHRQPWLACDRSKVAHIRQPHWMLERCTQIQCGIRIGDFMSSLDAFVWNSILNRSRRTIELDPMNDEHFIALLLHFDETFHSHTLHISSYKQNHTETAYVARNYKNIDIDELNSQNKFGFHDGCARFHWNVEAYCSESSLVTKYVDY